MFYLLTEPVLKLRGPVVEQFIELAQEDSSKVISYSSEIEAYSRIMEHDLFSRILTGYPRQIKAIADQVSFYDSLSGLYLNLVAQNSSTTNFFKSEGSDSDIADLRTESSTKYDVSQTS